MFFGSFPNGNTIAFGIGQLPKAKGYYTIAV